MSGKCEGIKEQLGDCIDSLCNIRGLLHKGHVISDSNSFTKSLYALQVTIADLSRGLIAPSSAEDSTADFSSEEVTELGFQKDVSDENVDDFDSMLCNMNDEEFDLVVNSQPQTSTDDVTACSGASHDQNGITGGIPSPCQQHVDKLKQVFGHSQFKP